MDQVIKQRWIEGLRSGAYKQTIGSLRDKHGFCCLGVLCDLYIHDHVGKARWELLGGEGDRYCFAHDHDVEWSLLPVVVARWAGLTVANPSVGGGISLSVLNDGGGSAEPYSFGEIANEIEQNL